jgi:hypothetical protein
VTTKELETDAQEEDVSLAPINKGATLRVKEPKYGDGFFTIEGTSMLVIHGWSSKSRIQMREKQEKGSTAKRGLREAKDFDAAYNAARYISTDGWDGIPATAIKSAMVNSCRLAGIPMLIGKLSLFVVSEGVNEDGVELVQILDVKPLPHEGMVRVSGGAADIRMRPSYVPGWRARVHIKWDSDQVTHEEIVNLLIRAGTQVGICEGRPSAPKSCGMGWGLFKPIKIELSQ